MDRKWTENGPMMKATLIAPKKTAPKDGLD